MEASILELDGKNAIVTGGSLGIGAIIAFKLAENGANWRLTIVNMTKRRKM